MKPLSILLTFALAAATHAQAAKKCDGMQALSQGKPTALLDSVQQLVSQGKTGDVECASILAVAKAAFSPHPKAGRRLEDQKPFDPAAAQANLEAAQRDPDTGKRLAELRGQVKDEALLLYMEAAVLDEDGFYPARDLRIQQLQQRLH
jgi:hypothetical protein